MGMTATILVVLVILMSAGKLGSLEVLEEKEATNWMVGKLRIHRWYVFLKKLGGGFFGEAWVVRRRGMVSGFKVAKIIKEQVADHSDFKLSGLREVYFGEVISKSPQQEGKDHVYSYIESFEYSKRLFIVSDYGGVTLDRLMYDRGSSGEILKPSSWWQWMRETNEGSQILKQIIFQLLTGVDYLHKLNIIHRDIKPDNLVLCFQKPNRNCSIPGDGSAKLNLRLLDFGSAVDDYSRWNLYGLDGPSRYDTWTVGQVIMELLLGTPDVFVTDRPYSSFKESRDFSYNRVDLMDLLCIELPWGTNHRCSDKEFSARVKARDPLNLGFPDVRLLQLVRKLLAGDPKKRWSAKEALQHLYFKEDQNYHDEL